MISSAICSSFGMSTRPPNCSIELTKQSKHRFCSAKSSIYTPPVHSLIVLRLIAWYQNALRSCHDLSLKNFKFYGETGRGSERKIGKINIKNSAVVEIRATWAIGIINYSKNDKKWVKT